MILSTSARVLLNYYFDSKPAKSMQRDDVDGLKLSRENEADG